MQFKHTTIVILAILSIVIAHPEEGNPAELRALQDKYESNCGKRDVTCIKQTDVTEGPYYYQTNLLRQNITEGKVGVPLILNITIVNVNTCNVVPLAAVDVWHCDATGLYSHFHVQGNLADANSTFLRGIQFTDTNGVATIRTIVPAFYTGRATHIHFKVHINGTTADGGIFSSSQEINPCKAYSGGYTTHTGQLFFNDTFLDSFYGNNPAGYSFQGTRIKLSNDNVFAQTNYGILAISLLNDTEGYSGGYFANITVGVDVSASPSSTTGQSTTSQSTTGKSTTGTTGKATTGTTDKSTTGKATTATTGIQTTGTTGTSGSAGSTGVPSSSGKTGWTSSRVTSHGIITYSNL